MQVARSASLLILLTCLTSPLAHADQADQINLAIPLSNPAQTALSQMQRLVRDKTLVAGIQTQLGLRMKLRALTCAQSLNINPNLPMQQLHDSYAGSPCFAKQDDDIANWLGMRTVGYMLAQPALRPMPAAALQTITDSAAPIRRVFFAAQAGVAVVNSQKDVEVIDLASGAPISSQFSPAGPLLAISPNGRVYVGQDFGRNGRLDFYSSQDGTLLAYPLWNQYATGCGFPWLDAETALTTEPGTYDPMFFDFSTGTMSPVDGGLPKLFCVTPVTSPGAALVGFTEGDIVQFKLTHGTDGKPHAQVLQSKQGERRLITSPDTGLMAGGQHYVSIADGRLTITDLADLSDQSIQFGRRFTLQQVAPTSDPDQIILGGTLEGQTEVNGPTRHWQFYAYALKEQTLSLLYIGRDLLGVQNGLEFIYDSPQNTLYSMKNAGQDSQLVRVDTLTGDAPVTLAAFEAETSGPAPRMKLDVNNLPPGVSAVTLKNGKMDKVYTGSDSQPSASGPAPSSVATLPANTVMVTTSGGEINQVYTGNPAPAAPGSVSALAQNADVQGIGIVESAYMTDANSAGTAAAAQPDSASMKIVHVTIRSRHKPLVLVLSSHSGVQWQLDVKWGAQLSAVLLSGPSGSSVQGQGDVPVVTIGSAYSYAMGSPGYAALQNEVISSTGKRMGLFQSGGAATQFSVY